MATTTFHESDGNGSNKDFTYSFPTIIEEDVKALVDGVKVDNFTIVNWTATGTKTLRFDNTTGTLNSNVCESSGAPKSGLKVRVYRDTEVDDADKRATYQSGSALKAEDLNDTYQHVLNALQEEQNQTLTADKIADNAITSAKIKDATIVNADIANTTITGGKLVDNTITATQIAADAIGASELADNSVATANIIDGTIINADISNSAAIEFTKLENLDSAKILVGNSSNKAAEVAVSGDVTISNTGAVTIATGAVEHAMLAADCIDGDNIQDDVINSEHYAAASIDTEHIAVGQIITDRIANDAIDNTKIATNAVNSDSIQDGQVIRDKIAADAINGDKIVDDAVGSEHIAVNAVVTAAIADDAVTHDKLKDDASTDSNRAVTTNHIRDNAVTFAKIGCEETTLTANSNVLLPTSKAVADYVQTKIDPIGGLEVIENRNSFPETIPATGVVVSIEDAGGIVVNGSGVSTTPDTISSDGTVTINQFPSDLQSTTIADGVGLMVTSTGSSHTYNYHKALLKEADLVNLSTDIQDFGNRYRTGANRTSNNDSSNDDGDLFFDQTANKMYVYDGANDSGGSWKEVTSTGEFKLLTVVPDGATSGSPVFNASNVSYDLRDGSNAASVDQPGQLIVSLNGVIQKPNSGTYSNSEEGFYLEGSNGIKFCTAPESGSSLFVTQCGSAVTINVPADDSVTAAKTSISLVAGDIIYGNGTDSWTRLAKPSSNKFLRNTSGGSLSWETVATDVVSDTSPQLGGDLDIQARTITTSTTDGNIALVPDGDGVVTVGNSSTAISTLKPASGKDLKLQASTSYLRLYDGENGGTHLSSTGSGNVAFEAGTTGRYKFHGSSGQVATLTTHGTSDLLLDTSEGTNSGTIKIEDGADNDILITPNGTGDVIIDGLKYPQADGSANQVLKTDGSGQLSWTTPASAIGGATGVDFNDSVKARFGTGNDLAIYHNGTDAMIDAEESGDTRDLYIKSGDGAGADPGTVQILANDGNKLLRATNDAGVELFFDNTLKLNIKTDQIETRDDIVPNVDSADSIGTNTKRYANGYFDTLYGDGSNLTGISGGVSSDAQNNTKAGDAAGNALDADTLGNTLFGENAGTAINSGDYNHCFGFESGKSITSGNYNIAVGFEALKTATTGGGNIAIGHKAMNGGDITGANNVAIGYEAGKSFAGNTNGNVAVGYRALYTQSGDKYNTALGYEAGMDITDAHDTVAVGHKALHNLTTGAYNTAVGWQALESLVDGQRNTAVGRGALDNTVSGGGNTALGVDAGMNTTASDNVCIGLNAGRTNETGNNNVYIGTYVADQGTDGANNVCIGTYSMSSGVSSYNTLVGYATGHQLNGTDGNNNTLIGYAAGYQITEGHTNVCLGYEAGYGQIGTDDYRLFIARGNVAAGSNSCWVYGDGDGNVIRAGNGTAWSQTSDERIKKNIVDNNVGLSVINNVRVRNFEYRTEDEIDRTQFGGSNDDPKYTAEEAAKHEGVSEGDYYKNYGIAISGTQIGVIAQELETVCPGCVKTDSNGKKQTDTTELIWHMVNAIKELSAKVTALEAG